MRTEEPASGGARQASAEFPLTGLLTVGSGPARPQEAPSLTQCDQIIVPVLFFYGLALLGLLTHR